MQSASVREVLQQAVEEAVHRDYVVLSERAAPRRRLGSNPRPA